MLEREIMIPGEVFLGTYINRPNKFLVNLIPEGKAIVEPAFLHDPGRLKELLLPKAKLLIRKPFNNKERKTKWDILAVEKNGNWITINSSFPNKIVKKALNSGWIPELGEYDTVKPEYRYGESRLDFFLTDSKSQKKALVEVKGVTLLQDDIALFPDSPTKRGTRHLRELIKAQKESYESFVIFIVMSEEAKMFKANNEIDSTFSKHLLEAKELGVKILPYRVIPKISKKRLGFQFSNKLLLIT